jgi:hypothetical protein
VEDWTQSEIDHFEAGSESQTEVLHDRCHLFFAALSNHNDFAEPLFAPHYLPQRDHSRYESDLQRDLLSSQRLTG